MTRKLVRAFPLLAVVVAASPLAAQAEPPAGRWLTVLTDAGGTVVSIDSASISHSRDSTFVVRTAVRFPQPVQLEGSLAIDREVDAEELDCAGVRTRGLRSVLHLDTAVVRRLELTRAWTPVTESRRPLFDARCAFLLGSFAAALPTGYELSAVDEEPELENRGAVASAIVREFRQTLRSGRSGVASIRMRIGADGGVDPATIRVVESTHPDFTGPAARVVRVMRFRPARVGGAAVPAWVTLPVSFSMQP
jgi:TonB family protein